MIPQLKRLWPQTKPMPRHTAGGGLAGHKPERAGLVERTGKSLVKKAAQNRAFRPKAACSLLF